jgi:hypothetical protein
MRSHSLRLLVACVGVILTGWPAAGGQVQQPAGTARLYPVPQVPQIAPGVTLQGYGNNVTVLGKGYNQVPQALIGPGGYSQGYGANMYSLYGGTTAGNYGGGYSASTLGSPYTGGYGPGTAYDPSYGGGYNPYYGGYNPYYYSPAYEIQAYAQLGISQEQARILREQANQAKLDTRKKLVDTLAYERANKYTFTQEQADIAKRVVERLQKTPTTAEVVSGKSMNILIDDLAKMGHLQLRGQTVTLDEDLLRLLNVSANSTGGNLALLRDNGRFAWPSVFENKAFDAKLRKDVEIQSQELYQQALNAKLDKNVAKDLKANLRTLRDVLSKNRSQLLTQEYLEGQRFLDDFDNAVVALERGDATLNVDFQSKFAKGGKTVQELVEYMNSKGLKFVGAASGDERAYHALQAALAAHSIMLHSQAQVANKE